MNTYNLIDVCAFSKAKNIWGEFGNMSGGFPLRISPTILIPSAENLYQAIRFTDHPEIQEEIIKQKSGFAAKLISKKYRKTHTREDFDTIKVQAMKFCLQLKKKQHKKYRDTLLLTQNKHIVELSHKDTFWGTLLNENTNTLSGLNILGILHEEIRQEIINGNIHTIDDPNINNFFVMGVNLLQL